MKDSLVTKLDLGEDPAATALQSLALWRSSVVAGSVMPAASPLLDFSQPAKDAPMKTPEVKKQSSANATTGNSSLWNILADFSPESGTKPAAVRFPDGSVASTPNWADFIAEVVRWLKAKGRLAESDLPIQVSKGTTILVGLSPKHKTGREFQTLRKVDNWFVNANYDSGHHVLNARSVIHLANLDPRDFAVQLQ